jgi:hypothetical protein
LVERRPASIDYDTDGDRDIDVYPDSYRDAYYIAVMTTGKLAIVKGPPTPDVIAEVALDPLAGILYIRQGVGWGAAMALATKDYVNQQVAGQGGKVSLNFEYDFAIDGGNTGYVLLRGIGNPQAIPASFIATLFQVDVLTILDSATHTATGGFSMDSPPMDAGNVLPPDVVTDTWASLGLFTPFEANNALKFADGADGVHFDIGVENLTQGKFKVHIEGYIEP